MRLYKQPYQPAIPHHNPITTNSPHSLSRSKPELPPHNLTIPNPRTLEWRLHFLLPFLLFSLLSHRHQMLMFPPLEILRRKTLRPPVLSVRRSILVIRRRKFETLRRRSLNVIGRIATENSEFGTGGGDGRLVVVWIGALGRG